MGQLESIEIDGIGELETRTTLKGDLTLRGIAECIKRGEAKNIVVMCGAGISVSAGIPDFRSPGTGLYYNLKKYHLPEPECMFDLNYFKEKPEAFYRFVLEMYPDQYLPTITHYFIKLLYKKNLLLRCYTQNIDDLERNVDIPDNRLVQSHGSFSTASCIKCGRRYKTEVVKKAVLKNEIPHCKEKTCRGYIKPDIVFFGEPLPLKFNMLNKADMLAADLLIVMGTSLQVQPFCGLVNKVKEDCPRLLINREPVGPFRFYTMDCCYRDVVYLGDCDSGVRALCKELGWLDELEDMFTKGNTKLEKIRQKYIASKLLATAKIDEHFQNINNTIEKDEEGNEIVKELMKEKEKEIETKKEMKNNVESEIVILHKDTKDINTTLPLVKSEVPLPSIESKQDSYIRMRNSSASSVSSDMLLSTDDDDFTSDYNSMRHLNGNISPIGKIHTINI